MPKRTIAVRMPASTAMLRPFLCSVLAVATLTSGCNAKRLGEERGMQMDRVIAYVLRDYGTAVGAPPPCLQSAYFASGCCVCAIVDADKVCKVRAGYVPDEPRRPYENKVRSLSLRALDEAVRIAPDSPHTEMALWDGKRYRRYLWDESDANLSGPEGSEFAAAWKEAMAVLRHPEIELVSTERATERLVQLRAQRPGLANGVRLEGD